MFRIEAYFCKESHLHLGIVCWLNISCVKNLLLVLFWRASLDSSWRSLFLKYNKYKICFDSSVFSKKTWVSKNGSLDKESCWVVFLYFHHQNNHWLFFSFLEHWWKYFMILSMHLFNIQYVLFSTTCFNPDYWIIIRWNNT